MIEPFVWCPSLRKTTRESSQNSLSSSFNLSTCGAEFWSCFVCMRRVTWICLCALYWTLTWQLLAADFTNSIQDSQNPFTGWFPIVEANISEDPTNRTYPGLAQFAMSAQHQVIVYLYTVASAQRWCLCIMSQTLRILRAYSGQIPNLYLIILSAYTDPRYEAYLIWSDAHASGN